MDFLVPKLSATMETVKVVRWLKEIGDKVAIGEPLVELETDKAAMEVEFAGGRKARSCAGRRRPGTARRRRARSPENHRGNSIREWESLDGDKGGGPVCS